MIINKTPSSLDGRRRPVRASRHGKRAQRDARRGSTLLIVLTLMGLLALLGVLFYTFAAQERATAASFSNDARITSAPSLEPDLLFDYALEQLILGPDDSKANSALAGGRHSLIPNMLGRDGIPFNGEGINLRVDASGNPRTNQTYDGATFATTLLAINDSVSANASSLFNGQTVANLPAPDVEYTYPGINHAFLAFRTTLPNLNDSNGKPVPVIIPSFHRPGALTSGFRSFNPTTSPLPDQWYRDSTMATRVFRPHVSHRFANASGVTAQNRFVYPSADTPTSTDLSNLASLGLQSFFPLPSDVDGNGVRGEQGLYSFNANTNTASRVYEYDVDLDGDGVRESVLLDLDYTPQRRGDGKLVVPMFSFYITDGEGLIDLNSAGNVGANAAGNPTNNILPPDLTTTEFAYGADFSRSNAGVSPGEINPLAGLYAVPNSGGADGLTTELLAKSRQFLQVLGGTGSPRSVQELRNIEGFFLLMGSPDFGTGTPSINNIFGVTPGRYGESGFLMTALRDLTGGNPWSFPAPGVKATDDNSNFSLVRSPLFGWPFDYRGTGNIQDQTTGFGKQLRQATNATISGIGGNRWLRFNQFHTNNDISWQSSSYGSQLMENGYNQLGDEAQEELTDVVDSTLNTYLRSLSSGTQPLASYDADAQFAADETAFLHLSPSDGSRLARGSRLAKLAPANFVNSARSWDIRRQFTTLSGDRRELGKWQPNSTTSAGNLRSWENAFPPTFASPQPMRQAVRDLLGGVAGTSLRAQRFKLNLHQILCNQSNDPLSTATTTSLQFRELTDHPLASATLAKTAINSTYAYPPGSPAAFEYWARRDRQALCRDIYILLFLLGDEDNTPTHTTTDMKRMAQFAANLVDSMDSDDVLTRFEYDTDLSNGWNVDDNPYTSTGETDRAEVWGVERQQLVLNEAFAIYAPPNDNDGTATPASPTDHTATDWDDTTANYFAYFELLNASPSAVDLNNSNWQILVWPRGSDTTNNGNRQAARQLIFRAGGSVGAGQRYSIGTDAREDTDMSSGTIKPSIFKVDRDMDGFSSADNLVPFVGSLNLDLITDRSSNKFYILDGNCEEFATGSTPTDHTSTAGSLLNNNNVDPAIAGTTSGTPVLPLVVSVRRRANLQRTAPSLPTTVDTEENDNPWVEVDRFEIGAGTAGFTAGFQKFDLRQSSSASSSPTLTQLVSDLRSATSSGPFASDAPQATTASSNLSHTINQANRTALATDPAGTVTQFHFDRPFQSLSEVFEVPLVGHTYSAPTGTTRHELREAVSYAKLSGQQQLSQAPAKGMTFGGQIAMTPSEDLNGNGSLDSGEDENNNGSLDTSNGRNRWYRLLNFVELTGTTNRQSVLDAYSTSTFGTPTNFGWTRESGRINLNTIRHHTVLSALLDDPYSMTLTPTATSQSTYLQTNDATDVVSDPFTSGTGPRDWWKQFLLSRDSFDGITPDPVTSLFLPGLGSSRPFRGLDFTARGGVSRNDTVLRRLPADTLQTDARLLFELTSQSEHVQGLPASASDSLARYRLYQKVLNRTTNRSNTFMVYVGVQFHEAVEVDVSGTKVVRIGGRLEDTPIHRGFFVVDRSGAIDQVKRLLAPSGAGGAGRTADHNSSTGILKKQTLTTPVDYYSYRALSAAGADDGIDWKSLIKFRQLLN